jgi:hypothetical protein
MKKFEKRVLIVGSAPDAVRTADWDTSIFTDVIVINNAWRACPYWNCLIFPEDFPTHRMPDQQQMATKKIVTAADFVPVQNDFGGFIYAGGTMSFTAGYWALGAIQPDLIAFIGCDMVYEETTGQPTHFYGYGKADPLRDDITLQSLEAKSLRFQALALQNNCSVVNLSQLKASRLMFPRCDVMEMAHFSGKSSLEKTKVKAIEKAIHAERELGYFVASGRYWEVSHQFNKLELSKIDDLWLATA